MNYLKLDGFKRLYRGLLGDLLCWILLIAGYFLQFSMAFRGEWTRWSLFLSRFSLILSQVGMALAVLTVLIGITDIRNMAPRLVKTGNWYFARLLLQMATCLDAIMLLVQSGTRATQNTPLIAYHWVFSAGLGLGMVLLVLVNMMESRSLLDGLSDVADVYGAGRSSQKRIAHVRLGITISCIGELLSLAAIVVCQMVLIGEDFYVEDIAFSIGHFQQFGVGGVLLVTSVISLKVSLLVRAGAETELVKLSQKAWKTMQEISE